MSAGFLKPCPAGRSARRDSGSKVPLDPAAAEQTTLTLG